MGANQSSGAMGVVADGRDALHKALWFKKAARADPQTIIRIVQNDPEAPLRHDYARGGNVPLHYAAKYGADPLVIAVLLCICGEAARQTNDHNRFPLHEAYDPVFGGARPVTLALLNAESRNALATHFPDEGVAAAIANAAAAGEAHAASVRAQAHQLVTREMGCVQGTPVGNHQHAQAVTAQVVQGVPVQAVPVGQPIAQLIAQPIAQPVAIDGPSSRSNWVVGT